MEEFQPELGQLCFGHAFQQYDCPDFVIAGLDYLAREIERVEWNRTQKEYSAPIHNNGEEYKTDAFEMRAFYWGDCECGYEDKEYKWHEENKHQDHCYQIDYQKLRDKFDGCFNIPEEIVEELCDKHQIPYNGGRGSAVHCNCDYSKRWEEFASKNDHDKDCRSILPNFKCGDFEIYWYKYLGRGTSMNQPIDANEFAEILDKCLKSVRALDKDI